MFEGRVYSSGYSQTVEMYDHIADTWSNIPNMIEERHSHKSVAIKNKLFVVGGSPRRTCEVYDSTCDNFVLLKQLPVHFQTYLGSPGKVISIGSKLFVFGSTQPKDVLVYDVENDEWKKESFGVKHGLSRFCCVKVPQL